MEEEIKIGHYVIVFTKNDGKHEGKLIEQNELFVKIETSDHGSSAKPEMPVSEQEIIRIHKLDIKNIKLHPWKN